MLLKIIWLYLALLFSTMLMLCNRYLSVYTYLYIFFNFSEIFVANVFNSNSEEEEKLCCNQLVSRVFEKLLPLAPSDVKTRIMTKLGSDLRLYVTNPFASHILETLLTLASFKQKSEQESPQEFSEFRREWVLKVSKYCINNLAEFAQDSYARFI